MGDSLTPDPRFTILLEAGDDTPDVAIAQNLTATSFDPPTLANDTVYYWQVVVYGSNGETQFGPVWSFRTEPWYDPPPVGSLVNVPAGWFTMGCDMNNHGFGDGCNDKDMPLHRVWLSAYAIDKYEVTNVEYRACVRAGACSLPRKTNSHESQRLLQESQVRSLSRAVRLARQCHPVLHLGRQAPAYRGRVGEGCPRSHRHAPLPLGQ